MLISQFVAEKIRPLVDRYDKPVPAILEIPSKVGWEGMSDHGTRVCDPLLLSARPMPPPCSLRSSCHSRAPIDPLFHARIPAAGPPLRPRQGLHPRPGALHVRRWMTISCGASEERGAMFWPLGIASSLFVHAGRHHRTWLSSYRGDPGQSFQESDAISFARRIVFKLVIEPGKVLPRAVRIDPGVCPAQLLSTTGAP